MKTLLTTIAVFFLLASTFAQMVGIGTKTPYGTFHIKDGSLGATDIILENTWPVSVGSSTYGRLLFMHVGSVTGGLTMSKDFEGNSKLEVSMGGYKPFTVTGTGNVGIGTTNPTHKFEVEGIMRVAGNVGIGVSTPTARLDVSGSVRLRTAAGFGRTLVSDADGNATWQQGIAFRAHGTLDGVVYPIAKYGWAKVLFNQTARYNYGFGFQPLSSEFLVPYKGVYHFDVQAEFSKYLNGYSGIRLMVRRGGGSFIIAENSHFITSSDGEMFNNQELPLRLGLDMQLEAGDFVYVEVNYGNDSPAQGITFEPSRTWFTGHMVMRVP